VEDPIEYVHTPISAIVSQREIGTHVASYAAALEGAARSDADVFVIGEIRDVETLRHAIAIALGGRLVMATVNAKSASAAALRLVQAFPPGERADARTDLVASLQLVIGQRLLPGTDRLRPELALEVAPRHDLARGLAARSSEESLADLVKRGRVTRQTAMDHADSPPDLEELLVAHSPAVEKAQETS
jgi:twitching motility protein PilT